MLGVLRPRVAVHSWTDVHRNCAELLITLTSVEAHAESMREQIQESGTHHIQILILDPPFISVPPGGAAQATAAIYTFALEVTVSLTLRTEAHALVPQMTLQSDPATIDVPFDGRALFPFTLTVAPSIEPGIYELRLNLETTNISYPRSESGYSITGRGSMIIVEVTPPGP